MQHSKQSTAFAYELVSTYAKWDALEHSYSLTVSDIPDFALHALAAHIMASDTDYAAESTSQDNYHYNERMLASLIRMLADSTNPERDSDFSQVWKDGVTKYYEDTICELLNEQLVEFCYDKEVPDAEC